MKKVLLIAFLCFLLSGMLVGWAWAQGDEEGQPQEGTQTEETVEEEEIVIEEPVKPNLLWGDYRYTFTSVAPSSDLDPQSVIINWFSPDLYYANWSHANYVHLKITIEWMTNDRSLDYMPLQLTLHSGNRSYILFGKNCSNSSYIWRRGNHSENDLGSYYPDHVGDDARIIFTFDTNGAAIDLANAYIEVQGMLEVWNWDLDSQLYTIEALLEHGWYRTGSSYFTYTHLRNIPLMEILPAPE